MIVFLNMFVSLRWLWWVFNDEDCAKSEWRPLSAVKKMIIFLILRVKVCASWPSEFANMCKKNVDMFLILVWVFAMKFTRRLRECHQLCSENVCHFIGSCVNLQWVLMMKTARRPLNAVKKMILPAKSQWIRKMLIIFLNLRVKVCASWPMMSEWGLREVGVKTDDRRRDVDYISESCVNIHDEDCVKSQWMQ